MIACLAASSQLPAQESARLPLDEPHLAGFNAGITLAGAHDSYLGWYNAITPAVSYTFSPRYSTDLSVPLYPYRLGPNIAANATTTGAVRQPLVNANGDLGDMLTEFHAGFHPHGFQDVATAAMSFPTGNREAGLGTGRVTFNLDNLFEKYVRQTGFLVDIGGGDSSGLQNRLVTEDSSALGPLAQFQAGVVSWLRYGMSVQSLAYEQLPIGDQKTYATYFVGGRPPTFATVVTGHKVNEDNGFNTTLYLPVTDHVLFTGSYNRSLRLHLDTVSMGFTFTWKAVNRRDDSLIDRAMREAERGAAGNIPYPPL